MKNWKTLWKKILPAAFLIPLAVGTEAYLLSGENLTDALYASFALYFTNPVSDAYNIGIEIARWTAPLATAASILYVLRDIWKSFRDRIRLFWKEDSVAVYTDEACEILFEEKTAVVYSYENLKSYAKSHIILFSSDEKSLNFYEKHKKELEKKEVFIGIRELETGLLGKTKHAQLFDINGSIAGLLWKKIAVWNMGREELNIVVYGNDVLAQRIVSSALQLNLYSLKQKINYHFITNNKLFQIRHKNLNLMNEDKLYYYDTEDENTWEVIANADIIIIADLPNTDILQTILVKARDKDIYYYSPKEGDTASYLSFGKWIPFGRSEEVLTDDAIRRKKLIEDAVALNEYYAEQYHTEKDWKALDGFLKASNISAADYGRIAASMYQKKTDTELAELEHIRWCRFHMLNYYIYGETANGKNKDAYKRIHKDLVPYEMLSEAEKLKDLEIIQLFQRNEL